MADKHFSARILSVLLILALIFTMAPVSAYAEEDAPEEKAAAETYTITYHNNDRNSNRSKSVTHEAGETVSLNEVSFGRSDTKISSDGTYAERYVQTGWNTDKDGLGTGYLLTDTLTMPEENIELYGVWEGVELWYWKLTVEGPGTVKYKRLITTPNSEDWLYAREGDLVKVYTNLSRKVFQGVIHTGFEPIADDGMIFEGWYLYSTDANNRLETTQLGLADLKDLVLSDDIIAAGQDRIIAKFIENDGTYAKIVYRDSESDEIYDTKMAKIGEATPTLASDPVKSNAYFLGWDQEIAATVTGDATYYAQWLHGPTNENTEANVFTVHCTNENSTHEDASYSLLNYGTPGEIEYDEARNVYICKYTLDQIGLALSAGTSCYFITSGQEHFVEEQDPVITLRWNASQNLWVADGAQVVNVYHETGMEEVPADKLKNFSPIICVTDGSKTYKELKLIDGTYTVSDPVKTDLSGKTLERTITITDLDAYASKFGFLYEVDWANNIHDADYYVYYIVREQETRSYANGSTYIAWGDWKLDKIKTEYVSVGVINNEFLYGKELRVKFPAAETYTVTFKDGADETVFEDLVFESEGEVPYTEDDLYEAFGFLLEDYQREDGMVFYGWDLDPLGFDEITEDIVITAEWDYFIEVGYLDGADDEVFDQQWYDFYYIHDEFPLYQLFDEEGNPVEADDPVPVRDGYEFIEWLSLEDPDASDSFEEENTGFLVNVFEEPLDDEGAVWYSYVIILEAQWESGEPEETLHQQFVRNLYRYALNRELDFDDPKTGEADLEGYNSFTAALDDGMTGAEVVSKFIFSSEMFDKHLCNDCFIEALYHAILWREPDDAGMAYWKSVLEYEGLTRLEAFNRFVQPDNLADEFANLCERYEVEVAVTDIPENAIDPLSHGLVPMDPCTLCGQSNVGDFVTRLYETCLLREPDEGGLKSWRDGLYRGGQTGYSVAYRFVFGDRPGEGTNHELTDQNLCNKCFVKRMYKALLGRELDLTNEADQAALDAYSYALDIGMSREEVFSKFIVSEEFEKICIKAGIEVGTDNMDPIPEPGEGTYFNKDLPCGECGE